MTAPTLPGLARATREALAASLLAGLDLAPGARALLVGFDRAPAAHRERATALSAPDRRLLAGLAAFDAALVDLTGADDPRPWLTLAAEWLAPGAPLIAIEPASTPAGATREALAGAGLAPGDPLPLSAAGSLALRLLSARLVLARSPL